MGIYQLGPFFDSVFFTEAEGADLADTSRRQWYMDRLEIAELKLLHAETDAQKAEFEAIILYYSSKIVQLDEGESR